MFIVFVPRSDKKMEVCVATVRSLYCGKCKVDCDVYGE